MKFIALFVSNRLLKSQLILALFLLFLPFFPNLSEFIFILFSSIYKFVVYFPVVLFPFSITELFWLLIIFFVLRYMLIIIHLIRSKQIKKILQYLQHLFLMVLIPLNLYTLTAGIAYRRPPLPLIFNYETPDPSSFGEIIAYFQNDFNTLSTYLDYDENGSVINPLTWNELSQHLIESANNLIDPYFLSVPITVKPMTTSLLYTEFHITGMHLSLTTEAIVNTHVPDATIPFTIAHEIAHVLGVMREEDANLVALYLTLQSDIPYVRYSGYFSSFYALMGLTRYMEDEASISSLQSGYTAAIRRDYQYQSTFWSQYRLLDDVGTWINDLYLRFMGNEGVTSYVDVPVTEVVIENGVEIEKIVRFSPFQQFYFSLYPPLMN